MHASRTWGLVLNLRPLRGAEGDVGWTPFTRQTFFIFSILSFKKKMGDKIFKTRQLSSRSLEQLNVIFN